MATKKNDKKQVPISKRNHNARGHGNDPFFVKKNEAAKKVIEKYGLPKEFLEGKK